MFILSPIPIYGNVNPLLKIQAPPSTTSVAIVGRLRNVVLNKRPWP